MTTTREDQTMTTDLDRSPFHGGPLGSCPDCSGDGYAPTYPDGTSGGLCGTCSGSGGPPVTPPENPKAVPAVVLALGEDGLWYLWVRGRGSMTIVLDSAGGGIALASMRRKAYGLAAITGYPVVDEMMA